MVTPITHQNHDNDNNNNNNSYYYVIQKHYTVTAMLLINTLHNIKQFIGQEQEPEVQAGGQGQQLASVPLHQWGH